jgi:hypothetical protein
MGTDHLPLLQRLSSAPIANQTNAALGMTARIHCSRSPDVSGAFPARYRENT